MPKRQTCWIIFAIVIYSVSANATEDDLFREIEAADNAFFEAFNNCDIVTMKSMFSEELEFYHDESGLRGFAENMSATKALCSRNLGLKRALLKESLQIFPVKDFGAIQVGRHQFCHQVEGRTDCGTFSFTHIWKEMDSSWKLHRVISYGH